VSAAAEPLRAHRRTCPFCEAMCGVTLELAGDDVRSVRGDPEDVFSRGYLCPKAFALKDVQHDPDRVRTPLRRRGGSWQPVGWDEALAEAAERLAGVQRRHGDDAVALYMGNPTTHSYSATLAALELAKALNTRNVFSTASVDHLPHIFSSYHMFGNRAVLPVPDLDRTHFLLVLGANPVVSNGSLMSAPNARARLKALVARGGRLVVVDPRRTRTAELADWHLAIRPGTDVLLLLAMLNVLFEEALVRPGRLAALTDGVEAMRSAVAGFSAERAAPWTGIDAGSVRRLARDFAGAPSAVCYGRLGVCTQPFGAASCWLMTALNVLTGNLDREGGAMFASPAADLPRLAALLDSPGSFGRWKSRVRGLPEFSGELPLAALAEEVDTPGPGQVRSLVTFAGNPALSAPNAARLERALGGLEFMVSIDLYLNETTRHADLLLPGSFALQRDHYDLLLSQLTVRNVARYCPPAVAPDEGTRDDWRILLGLAGGILRRKPTVRARLLGLETALLRRLSPRRVIALAVRFGPHGAGLNPFGRGLTLRRLERAGTTIDLGPLRAGRLPGLLYTRGRRISLAPEPLLADLGRVRSRFAGTPEAGLVLVGRRQLRDNNSWLHNAPSLMRGRDRCTLWMCAADAGRLGLRDGQRVRVSSRAGAIAVALEVTDAIRPGVVSLPHGYGHGRHGTRLEVANSHAGASVNEITDDTLLDELSGTSAHNALPVEVQPHGATAPVSAEAR
jgi:anaerobic selenocysteine-containing dehydrogenase